MCVYIYNGDNYVNNILHYCHYSVINKYSVKDCTFKKES